MALFWPVILNEGSAVRTGSSPFDRTNILRYWALCHVACSALRKSPKMAIVMSISISVNTIARREFVGRFPRTCLIQLEISVVEPTRLSTAARSASAAVGQRSTAACREALIGARKRPFLVRSKLSIDLFFARLFTRPVVGQLSYEGLFVNPSRERN